MGKTSLPEAERAADRSAGQASLAVRVAFSRLTRRMREVATGEELSPSQASVLARLAKGEAGTASALAVVEGVRPQSMAATVSALEQLGLVRRTPDPTDGRRQLVTLTPAGRDRDEGNREARQEWLTRALRDRLTERERQTVIAAMALIQRVADA
jgi:DNA-binding MarR family transcriptional regulator